MRFVGWMLSLTVSCWAQPVSGTYVETRTCSLYVGACHYSGEYVTAGREAIMVWHFDEGAFAGLTAVAVVLGDSNLAEKCARRSVLYVSDQASEAARSALVSQIKKRYSEVLGQVIRVQGVPIRFEDDGHKLHVQVGERAQIAALEVARVTCHHCPMPHEVWYNPLVEVDRAVVGMARQNHYEDPQLKIKWARPEENSAFVAEFRW